MMEETEKSGIDSVTRKKLLVAETYTPTNERESETTIAEDGQQNRTKNIEDGQTIDDVRQSIEDLARPKENRHSEIKRSTREERIKQYEEKTVKPKRPSLWKTLAWLWRSRGAMRYNSSEDAQVYDEVARSYFKREKLGRQIRAEFLRHIEAEDPSQALICDRAAGTGIITEALLDAGFQVRASDLSEAQLEELESKLHVQTAVEDLNQPMIEVDDSSIDGIVEVAADRFMTAEGQEIFVREARRTLKDKGILVWPTFIGEYVGKLRHGWKWRASSRAKSKLLRKNGFEIISNELKLNGLSAAATCRILVARKID